MSFCFLQALCPDHPVCVRAVWWLDDVLSRLAGWEPQPQHQQLAVPLGLPRLLQRGVGSGTGTAAVAVLAVTQGNSPITVSHV